MYFNTSCLSLVPIGFRSTFLDLLSLRLSWSLRQAKWQRRKRREQAWEPGWNSPSIDIEKCNSNLFEFPGLRWPEPIDMRVGYVFKSRFSAGKIWPISMIFVILSKEWSNFKKQLLLLTDAWYKKGFRCSWKWIGWSTGVSGFISPQEGNLRC